MSTTATQAGDMPKPQYKRQLKNFLLMPGFQLKYTGFIVVISALLSTGLGYFVYQRTQEAYAQTNTALKQAKSANETARESSKMLAMENPALGDSLAKEDEKYAQAAKELEDKASALDAESKQTLLFLGGFVGLLVLSLAIFGIVFTHRVAGPLFVFNRMFQNIGQNNFQWFKRSLRKGDEFPEIFKTGLSALDHLTNNTKSDKAKVEESIALLESLKKGGADPGVVKQIEEKLRALSYQQAKI